MALDPLTAVLNIGGQIIDKIFPDKAEADRAKLELLKQQQAGEFKELESAYAAIVAEATSSDPWTSRARPAFLYVVYIFILAAIPMGFMSAIKPEMATAVTAGVHGWLNAIPENMWWLFGSGYLGYSAARSWDKKKGVR